MENDRTKLKSDFVSAVLEGIGLSGDAYATATELYKACKRERHDLSFTSFKMYLAEQILKKKICIEGQRLYETKTWRYEEHTADKLARLPSRPPLPKTALQDTLRVGGIELCEEQRAAVEMAVSSRLSIILGGAGSGKTTLTRGIVSASVSTGLSVLCAPTGKAARNLTARTGLTARTVHSALGMRPDEDFLNAVIWPSVRLVVIDEASMMTLEMLAGILEKAPDECRIVLIGDGNQLLSVGAGNVLPDLIRLGIPCFQLEKNHRQDDEASALLHNVVNFRQLRSAEELMFDNSFRLIGATEQAAMTGLVEEAIHRYLAGESVQVLAPYRKTVNELNQAIREKVNPAMSGKPSIKLNNRVEFREGDRVIITKNDRDRNCSNGDVGVLHIRLDEYSRCDGIWVELPDGRCPEWDFVAIGLGLSHMDLAYALTVHKSQGSEYDTILFPALMSMQSMLSRNLFYTAISRAKKRAWLYGSKQAVDVAMQKELPPRKSMLVAKTHMRTEGAA